MSLLSIFKTKKPKAMDLPPPPVPVDDDMPELPQIEAPPEAPIEPAPLPMDHDEMIAPPQPIQIQSPQPIAEPVEVQDLQQQEFPVEVEEPQDEQILDRRESISPLFVSTNDYQAILNGIGDIRKTLGDSENILAKLNAIKNSEEKVFSNWKLHMEDIERKLSYVDAVIAKNQELVQ